MSREQLKGPAIWLVAVLVALLLAISVAYKVRVGHLKAQLQASDLRQAEYERLVQDKQRELADLQAEIARLREQLEQLRREAAGKSAATGPAPAKTEEQAWMGIIDRFTFFPSKYPQGDWKPRGLQFEDCWFESTDGVKIHAWYCPHDKPRAAMLVSLGNAGNMTYWADFLRYLHDKLAVSTLVFDYRGYGRSNGVPTTAGILLDARAARGELAKREKIAPADVVLFGRSLGGAVAIDLAADGARGLVVESTFTSLRDVASQHYPAVLVKSLVPNVLNSLGKIPSYRGPLLISHGDADETVAYAHGRRLFEAAHEPKQFVTIARGGHNDPQSAEYYAALDKFLAALPAVK